MSERAASASAPRLTTRSRWWIRPARARSGCAAPRRDRAPRRRGRRAGRRRPAPRARRALPWRPRNSRRSQVHSTWPAAEVGERDAGKGVVPGIARQQRAAVAHRGRSRAAHPGRAPAPAPTRGSWSPKAPRPRRLVAHAQAADLHRIVDRHRERELERQAMRALLEAAVAEAVRAGIVRILEADRRGRRTPQLAAIFVAQVDSFAAAGR